MQLFELVADVPRYPEFLPWCQAGRIRRREGPNVQIAELAIGFGPFHEKFASRVEHLRGSVVIEQSLAEELLWLWDLRNRQHLHELTAPDFDFYSSIDDHPRAEAAVACLIAALKRTYGLPA